MSIYIWQTNILTFCACPLPFSDTTDVQLAESISVNDDIIKIMCYFARGSQALGCSVELVSPEDSVLWNITRENGLLVAERNITTALPAHCYNISVSELERDGTVGEVAVLVVEAEWDEACNPDSNPGSGVPPTSGTGAGTIIPTSGKVPLLLFLSHKHYLWLSV